MAFSGLKEPLPQRSGDLSSDRASYIEDVLAAIRARASKRRLSRPIPLI